MDRVTQGSSGRLPSTPAAAPESEVAVSHAPGADSGRVALRSAVPSTDKLGGVPE